MNNYQRSLKCPFCHATKERDNTKVIYSLLKGDEVDKGCVYCECIVSQELVRYPKCTNCLVTICYECIYMIWSAKTSPHAPEPFCIDCFDVLTTSG